MDIIFCLMYLNIFSFFVLSKKIPQNSEEELDATSFCRNRSRLIRLEKSDEVFVADVSANSTVLLHCKFCQDKDDGLPKIWYVQKDVFTGKMTEVDLGSESKKELTRSHSLVLRNVDEDDLGLYYCVPPAVDSMYSSFNYLLEMVNASSIELTGNLNGWKNYSDVFLKPVNVALESFSLPIPHSNITVKMAVYTEWSEWGSCEVCGRDTGIRRRVGQCRLRPVCQDPTACFDTTTNSTILPEHMTNATAEEDVLKWAIPLSCRGLLLSSLLPDIYAVTRSIPDYTLLEPCSGVCKGMRGRKGAKYKRRVILQAGAHLVLVCPESSINSETRWEHNMLRLYPNEGHDFIANSNEPRVYVDSFNTLYLHAVAKAEEGNYTCFVDGVRMQEVHVRVLIKSLFFTNEFRRHLQYLGYIFAICFLIYSAILFVNYLRKRRNKKRERGKGSKEEKENLLELENREETP